MCMCQVWWHAPLVAATPEAERRIAGAWELLVVVCHADRVSAQFDINMVTSQKLCITWLQKRDELSQVRNGAGQNVDVYP